MKLRRHSRITPRFVVLSQAFEAAPSRCRRWSAQDGHSEAMTEPGPAALAHAKKALQR
jgi:hypothetical protein